MNALVESVADGRRGGEGVEVVEGLGQDGRGAIRGAVGGVVVIEVGDKLGDLYEAGFL